jgi:hypothetical protein
MNDVLGPYTLASAPDGALAGLLDEHSLRVEQVEPAALDVLLGAWIRANRQEREPWQRADESVATIGARGGSLRGLAVERGGQVAAAAIVRDGDRVEALQLSRPTSTPPRNCCSRPLAWAASCDSGTCPTMRRLRSRSSDAGRDGSPRSTRCA